MGFVDVLLVIAGLFSIISSIANWDWYFNNSRAQFFVKTFGRNGARVFYIVIGGLLIFLGTGKVLGIW